MRPPRTPEGTIDKTLATNQPKRICGVRARSGRETAVKKMLLLSFLALEMAACGPAYQTRVSTQKLMTQIIDPAWDVYRHSSGTVETEAGSQNLTPTTDAGWRAADNAATSLAEAGNLLLLPGRSKGGDWAKAAQAMSRVALEARSAVEARDATRMFDIGGRLYQACTDCHQEYQLPLLDKARN